MRLDLMLRLDAARSTSLEELRGRDPELAGEIDGVIATHVDRALSVQLERSSPALASAVRERLRPAAGRGVRPLAELRADPALAAEAKARRSDLRAAEQLTARVASDLPVGKNAALRPELGRARVAALVTAAGVAPAVAQAVTDRIGRVAAVDRESLAALVESRAIGEEDARRVARAITIANVVGDDALARSLIAEPLEAVDLARLDAAGWRERIAGGRLNPPAGLTAERWADALAERAAAIFPGAALLGAVIPTDPPRALADIASRPEADRLALARRFPGLGIESVLGDIGRDAAARSAEVVRRVQLLARVRDQNRDRELLALDYSHDAEPSLLDTSGLSPEDRGLVVSALKSYQRVHALTGSAALSKTVLEAGYHSAVAVVMGGKPAFARKSGLGAALSDALFGKAQSTVADLAAQFGSIADAWGGGFGDIAVGNLPPSIQDYLKGLDGFADLFGSQSTCRCEHCQSILSPAAYFVDLMCFVEKHVSGVHFTGPLADHPLALRSRRPDLWKLELTCANTTDRIPTLDIHNEILENYIALAGGFAGALGDRKAVEDVVYRQALATEVDSFQQPFHLPLTRLDTYLAHFGEDRTSIARALDAAPAVATRGRLRLSAAEYALISQPNTDEAFLERIYRLDLSVAAGGGVAALDAHRFLRPMGVTRDQLGELVVSRFVVGGGVAIEIAAEKTSAESVQNDIERVRHLTVAALDRMHRFTRLQRSIGWSVRELDLVLAHLGAGELDPVALDRLAGFLALRDRFGPSVEELCALSGSVPRTAASASRPPLFDRLFNLPFFVQADGPLPQDGTRFVHPALRSGPPGPSTSALARLLGSLRVSDEDLLRLITALQAPLGFDVAAAVEDDRGFFLTADNLSLLYRHARLAGHFKVDIVDLFRLLSQAGLSHVASQEQLHQAAAHHAWWKASRYSLDQIAVAIGGAPRDPTAILDPAALAAKVVADVAASRALRFADTLFAFTGGVTEEQSRAVLAANPAALVPAPDSGEFWIASDFALASDLVIPAGVPLDPAAARDLLTRHHAGTILPVRLGAELGVDVPRLQEMAAMLGIDLAGPPLARALQGVDPPDALAALVAALLPLRALFARPVWDAHSLAFVRSQPQRFGIADFTAVAVDAVKRLSIYAAFADAGSIYTGTTPPIDPVDLRAVLAAFDPAQAFAAADPAQLARVLRAEPGLVTTIAPRLSLPGSAPEALEKLAAAVALAQRLGVSADTLSDAVSDDYGAIQRAADAILAAFRARYPDESEWLDKLAPFDDRIRGRKRDGLVAHLLHSLTPDLFEDENDLYHHFLIDVELGGCARTSRVVAAISSVQLYVHRVLMNLEQDRRAPSDPQHVAIPADSIPSGEWVWRKNYRVWEANRKVFLWPENYIEPELRDDKSPLFEELEAALLQQEITDQSVLDAYAGYLAGFDEIAKLTIAGVYHDVQVDPPADVLHLFGVAPGDPPIYYYRTAQNALHGGRDGAPGVVWSPWRKIDAQIPATRVGVTVYKSRLYLFWTERRSRSMNKVVDGSSEFGGYRHTMTLRMTTLRLDGTWSPPQDITLPGDDGGSPFGPSAGEILDPFWPPDDPSSKVPRLEYPDRAHEEPRDDYVLQGPNWEAVYLDDADDEFPGELNIVARNYSLYARVDLYRRLVDAAHTPRDLDGDDLDGMPVLCARGENRATPGGSVTRADILYYGHPVYWYPNRSSYADLVLDERRIERFNDDYYTEPLRDGLYQRRLLDGVAGLDLNLLSVAGSLEDAIIQHEEDVLYLQGSVRAGSRYRLSRIGTTLSERLNEKLFADGVEGILDTAYQLGLAEAPMPITQIDWRVQNTVKSKPLAYGGPAGVYYREIFFHIPFLIANALNAQGNHGAAQRWYHSMFNPTAAETTTPATDRNWRYAEFRGLGVTSLRDILTDTAAIEVYKNDPFNPHAIARLRLSAYQKCVVMKYIDNLLDWGDELFAQFTMESVGEATLLYVMASDILGERPAEIGACGEGSVSPKTYEMLEPHCQNGSDFLFELESYTVGKRAPWWSQLMVTEAAEGGSRNLADLVDKAAIHSRLTTYAPVHAMKASGVAAPGEAAAVEMKAVKQTVLGKAIASSASKWRGPSWAAASALAPLAAPPAGIFRGPAWSETRIGSWKTTPAAKVKAGASKLYEHAGALIKDKSRLASFGLSVVSQVSPAFCVPPNKDLRAYWDRVEDRLFKIRNCMDIAGVKRELALFAPEIDPRMLVRMKAAGLSLDDVVGALSGNLPPYRFLYLIERAKQAAGALQGYGAALLSALEKKDGEELGRLRTVHQQHLLQLTSKVRRWEIDAAEAAIEALERQKQSIEFRRDYYQSMMDGGLNPAEQMQAQYRLLATMHTMGAAVMDIVSSVLHLIPQAGSPFALKYGGLELGSSAKSWADFVRLMGGVADSISNSAGLIGGFMRRHEGWEYQRDVAEQELKPIDKHLAAARIRRDIMERSLEIHDKTIEQSEEVFEFLRDKFTSQALYTFLATTLQRLYREAYQGAFAMARLAEQAFRFERPDDEVPPLEPSYWDTTRAGFLAGEKLLIDLNGLERHFIETNYRVLEVDQPFSITQLDPLALVQLRETGSCEVAIPELFFDLFYPGHYDRRIKHVRLTIPCITGPYTNVSATLSLVSSQIRTKPSLGADGLIDVPPRRSVSIATSTAQSDAGVFELSFRDERYMPFEGLGAVSRWRISLPRSFRPFDYQTINDVILSISYTAREDQKFRDDVEAQNAAVEGTIASVLGQQPLGRLFSLRQDFSSAFHRLLHGAAGTQVPIEITERHFPLFLKGRPLSVSQATLALRPVAGQPPGAFAIQVGQATHTGFSPAPAFGNLPTRSLGPAFSAGIVGTHSFAITAPGDLAPDSPAAGDLSVIDARKLEDILLHVEYTVAVP